MADLTQVADLLERTATELKALLEAPETQAQLVGTRSGRPMPRIGDSGGGSMEGALDPLPYSQDELEADLRKLAEVTRTENRREMAARRVAHLLPVIAKIGTKLVALI